MATLPAQRAQPPRGERYFDISGLPLDDKYQFVTAAHGKTGDILQIAIVKRKSDGKNFLRDTMQMTQMTRIRRHQSLMILRTIQHENIHQIVDAYINVARNTVTTYAEINDLGSLINFSDFNELGRGNKRAYQDKLPIGFAWHVLLQILRGLCYLAYGYRSLAKVVETSNTVLGWDPIYHGSILKRDKTASLALKNSKTGKYPDVVLMVLLAPKGDHGSSVTIISPHLVRRKWRLPIGSYMIWLRSLSSCMAFYAILIQVKWER